MENSLKLPHVPALPGPFTVCPPGSKSIANRALPLAALTKGRVRLLNLPDGEDVTLMKQALVSLAVPLKDEADYFHANFKINIPAVTITGNGILAAPQDPAVLFLGNSGTATRILTALLAAGRGHFRVTGVPRMYERPIGDLVDALRPLCDETEIIYENKEGYPPLSIRAAGLRGGKTTIKGNLSSQFVTGLLMALPLCKERVEVEIEGKLVSGPYVDLTLQTMLDFGAEVKRDGYKKFWIEKPAGYATYEKPFFDFEFVVEPDASSASYFLAAAAITDGDVTIRGIGKSSPQGEARFAEALEKMGAAVAYDDDTIKVSAQDILRGIDIDMDLMSDTGMTLALVALFAEGRTTIRNVGNWRLKETDRLTAMATELRKLGATVEEGTDWIAIDPPARLAPDAVIDTYDDHRMAMCFSLVTLGPKGVPVTINDPGCVRKTYPGYWREFARMTGRAATETMEA